MSEHVAAKPAQRSQVAATVLGLDGGARVVVAVGVVVVVRVEARRQGAAARVGEPVAYLAGRRNSSDQTLNV